MRTKTPDLLPAKKSRGRPRLSEELATVSVTIRMTSEQRDKLSRIGGPPWIRKKIDLAKEPDQK